MDCCVQTDCQIFLSLSFFSFSGSLDPSPFSTSRRDLSHSADISAEPGIKALCTKQTKINRNEMRLIYIPHPTFIISFHSIPLLVPNYPISSSPHKKPFDRERQRLVVAGVKAGAVSRCALKGGEVHS